MLILVYWPQIRKKHRQGILSSKRLFRPFWNLYMTPVNRRLCSYNLRHPIWSCKNVTHAKLSKERAHSLSARNLINWRSGGRSILGGGIPMRRKKLNTHWTELSYYFQRYFFIVHWKRVTPWHKLQFLTVMSCNQQKAKEGKAERFEFGRFRL